MSTGPLLEQWRAATRAAQLAERLAEIAKASIERSDRDAAAAREIARMAEQAARHAERAAQVAREAADRAAEFARQNRIGPLAGWVESAEEARAEEKAASERYHEAELAARHRHEEEGGNG